MSMQNHALHFTSQEKDLGVIFNCRLLFDAHINEKDRKSNKTLEPIERTSTIPNEVTLVLL